MDLHHLLFAGLPAHPIPAVRGATMEPRRSTRSGTSPSAARADSALFGSGRAERNTADAAYARRARRRVAAPFPPCQLLVPPTPRRRAAAGSTSDKIFMTGGQTADGFG